MFQCKSNKKVILNCQFYLNGHILDFFFIVLFFVVFFVVLFLFCLNNVY